MDRISAVAGLIFLLAVGALCFAIKSSASGFSSEHPKQDGEAATVSPGDLPVEIHFPSCAGEVVFPHKFHYSDLEIACSDCHHETEAPVLHLPHPEYFADFWINCQICHRGEAKAFKETQPCSRCHHASPTDIADETLSAKVVVHKNCWGCHEVGTGEDASQSCSSCHSGKKKDGC